MNDDYLDSETMELVDKLSNEYLRHERMEQLKFMIISLIDGDLRDTRRHQIHLEELEEYARN